LAGLVLAMVLWITDGGGPRLYELLYLQAAKVEHFLLRAPGAPLSVLDSNRARAERFRLQGIVYSPARSLAVINEASCAPGERIAVKVGRSTQIIRCVEVFPSTVQIQTADGKLETLRLLLWSDADQSERSVAPEILPDQ
jgi:hypothetical protein